MIFRGTGLDGARVIDLERREDERGFFARMYCAEEFAAQGLNVQWAQINNSLSRETGTLRGLHFQRPPHAEVKVVRCVAGAVWDVIVDLRKGSASYGRWFGTELSARNRSMMYVPAGFAHGFITLEPDTEVIYLVSTPYSREHEGTLRWDDPFHGIAWPRPPALISAKDRAARDWTNQHAITIEP